MAVRARRRLPSGVYCIINLTNGKQYIGSSTQIRVRLEQHLRSLQRGTHDNAYLQYAWNKYGEEAFEFMVIERCPPEMCQEREQHWIDHVGTYDCRYGYNINPFATRPSFLGYKHSEETRGALSSKVKAYWASLSDEERRTICESRRGRKHTPEACAKMSVSRMGMKRTPESIAKSAEGQRGKIVTEETKAKLRAAWKRRKARGPTDKELEGRKKTAAAHKGRKLSAESRKKVGDAQRGKVVTEEQRKRISASLRRYYYRKASQL